MPSIYTLTAVRPSLLWTLAFVWLGCAPRPPASGLPAITLEKTWNQARELYFKTVPTPSRPYKADGVKGEILDLHVYRTPQPDLFLVTFGESWFNTTGWDVHVALLRTNDVPSYPGNVYLCYLGFDFACDWLSSDTLGVFYAAGYYPDLRDEKTRTATKNPKFQYERTINGITVRFIPVDSATMEAKRAAMQTSEINRPTKE